MTVRVTSLLNGGINRSIKYLKCIENKTFTTKLSPLQQQQQENEQLIIACKRKKLNYYKGQTYGKLEEIPLATKGWLHNKSRGDYIVIHADRSDFDHPSVPFHELNLHQNLLEVLSNQGITKATSFQSEAVPAVKSSKHVLLAAETGCGKTLAYLLPIIENIIATRNPDSEMNTPRGLILTPNRELALQIGVVAEALAASVGLNVKIVVGGHTKRLMLNPSFANIDLLIATPGAIGKLSTVGIYKLDKVAHTVIDEADSLLDDSFADRMSSLMRRVSQSQVVLVSATLPKKIPPHLEYIEQNLVSVKSPRLHKPLLNITQKFLRLAISARPSHLLQIAKQTKDPLLVFTNRNETCNWLAMFLRENGLKCANINGDMNYEIRIRQWNDFSKGFASILSATDVGSRGLDTTQVKQVLNYDFPLYAADYIHRIGRIGRLGSSMDCKVTNLVTGGQEIKLVQQIELAIRKNTEIQNVDGNITKLVQHKILKRIREAG